MINLNRPRREKMAKKDDTPKKSSSVFEEIEEQLEQALAKKKEDIEKELEERIRQEKEETQRRIEGLDKELKQERGALVDIQSQLDEFENQKAELKKQIKEHIDKAIKLQTEIETMTGQTLEELKTVSSLNQKLEELQQEAGEKVSALKKSLEEKFGIVADVPEGKEFDETELNLDHELAKLKKIMELLNSNGPVEEVVPEEQPEEKQPDEVSEKVEEEEAAPVEPEGLQPVEEMEAEPKEKEEAPEEEASFQASFDKLEEFRKGSTNENDAELSYFENNERIVLDGEFLVASLNNCFEEAKKLYIRLSQTESPKDQFFIKQEIIKQQEALRKVMLRSIRMCEKDNCSLPEYTLEILNLDVLKSALEKVSMQNWSNQDDFAAFDNFAKELKDSFYSRITPPAAYLLSIMQELEIS
jgi:hypothetical protein